MVWIVSVCYLRRIFYARGTRGRDAPMSFQWGPLTIVFRSHLDREVTKGHHTRSYLDYSFLSLPPNHPIHLQIFLILLSKSISNRFTYLCVQSGYPTVSISIFYLDPFNGLLAGLWSCGIHYPLPSPPNILFTWKLDWAFWNINQIMPLSCSKHSLLGCRLNWITETKTTMAQAKEVSWLWAWR